MWPDLFVVSTPSLHFCPGVVRAHESVRVQPFGPDLGVEGLEEAVVGRLGRPGAVEHDTLLVGPEVEITRDEPGALVNADGYRTPAKAHSS